MRNASLPALIHERKFPLKAHRLLLVLLVPLSLLAQRPDPQSPDFSVLRQQIQLNTAKGDVPGVAIGVAKNGRILWEEGFGWADVENQMRATESTLFFMASVTKSITATAIVQLQERGRLRLDNPVNDYLGPERVHSPMWNASEATVRGVLSHTSGLTTFARSCAPGESSCVEEEIERYGILVWPPGEVFDYSNLGYGILGNVVARASGESFNAYLQKAIFDPLGMHHCGLELNDSLAKIEAAQYNEKTHKRSPMNKVSGHPGASAVRCSAHDLLLFGMFHLKDKLKAHQLLTDADIEEMHEAQSNTKGQYGLGWWINDNSGYKIVYAQGGTSNAYALLILVPSQDLAIVVIANSSSKFISELGERILSALVPGFRSGSLFPTNQTSPSSSTPASLIGKWSGQIVTYKGPVNASLDIEPDGSAAGQIGTQPATAVTKLSFDPHHFSGRLPGDPGIADAPSHPYWIELDLALHDKDLIGAATSRDGDELPHWIKLSKIN